MMYCSPRLLLSSARWDHRSPRPPIGPSGGLSPPGSDQLHHPTATEPINKNSICLLNSYIRSYRYRYMLTSIYTLDHDMYM